MYKLNAITNLFLVSGLSLLLATCQKKGDFQSRPVFTSLSVTWKYNPSGTKPYRIEVDSLLFADSLKFDKTVVTKTLVMKEGKTRLTVKDKESGNLVLDTLIALTGGQKIELIQIFTDEAPFIYKASSTNAEPDPDARNKTKMQFVYSDSKLPDSITLRFFIMNAAVKPYKYDNDTIAVLKVRRKEFSSYVQIPFGRYAKNTGYLFQIKDAANDTLVQAIAFPTVTSQAVTLSKGWSNSLYDGRNRTTGLADLKFLTTVLKYGGPSEAVAANRDKFFDLTLFKTNW